MYMNERTRIRKTYKIIADGVEVFVTHNSNQAVRKCRDLQKEGTYRNVRIANEYVAALAAHSAYWIEKDLSLFVARQIHASTLEEEENGND